MAKAFIYDSVDLLDGTLTDGTYVVNGGTNFVPGAALTNEERAIDQSIGLAVSSWAQNDMLRIDLGASPGTPDRFAIIFNATEDDNLKVYAGAHATDLTVSTEVLSLTSQFVANVWTVSAFDTSPGNVRYYFIRSSSAGGLVSVLEIIIGKIYTFEQKLIQGGRIGDIPGVDILTSHGGIEYSNKRHNPRTQWSNMWKGLSSTNKTNLESFRSDVGINHKKFLYYDGSSYHWVRMTEDSLIFTNEVGKVSYSAPITLIKQLQ